MSITPEKRIKELLASNPRINMARPMSRDVFQMIVEDIVG
jgi:hypothetical protein